MLDDDKTAPHIRDLCDRLLGEDVFGRITLHVNVFGGRG
jgi:hypothetical protein